MKKSIRIFWIILLGGFGTFALLILLIMVHYPLLIFLLFSVNLKHLKKGALTQQNGPGFNGLGDYRYAFYYFCPSFLYW